MRGSFPVCTPRAARVDLGGPLAVRELELCILSLVAGRRGGVVGLGEIELALASR